VFTAGVVDVPAAAAAALAGAGIALYAAPITRLVARGDALEGVELADGTTIARDILFAHPPQRQVELVRALGVALDDDGYVKVEPLRPETSVPGVYAAGDLTTRGQAAILAAAAGMQAAAALNVSLALDPTTA
jgi:thioredoxin reductase